MCMCHIVGCQFWTSFATESKQQHGLLAVCMALPNPGSALGRGHYAMPEADELTAVTVMRIDWKVQTSRQTTASAMPPGTGCSRRASPAESGRSCTRSLTPRTSSYRYCWPACGIRVLKGALSLCISKISHLLSIAGVGCEGPPGDPQPALGAPPEARCQAQAHDPAPEQV